MTKAKKALATLSAEELFALANEKQREELEEQQREQQVRIAELRSARRKLVAMQRKEVAAIDAEIRGLGGGARRKPPRGGRADGLSARILAILEASGDTSIKGIRAELEAQGTSHANLNQTLAYLKRTGRIVSRGRAIYALA